MAQERHPRCTGQPLAATTPRPRATLLTRWSRSAIAGTVVVLGLLAVAVVLCQQGTLRPTFQHLGRATAEVGSALLRRLLGEPDTTGRTSAPVRPETAPVPTLVPTPIHHSHSGSAWASIDAASASVTITTGLAVAPVLKATERLEKIIFTPSTRTTAAEDFAAARNVSNKVTGPISASLTESEVLLSQWHVVGAEQALREAVEKAAAQLRRAVEKGKVSRKEAHNPLQGCRCAARKIVEASVRLANFFLARGRPDEAQSTLRHALAHAESEEAKEQNKAASETDDGARVGLAWMVDAKAALGRAICHGRVTRTAGLAEAKQLLQDAAKGFEKLRAGEMASQQSEKPSQAAYTFFLLQADAERDLVTCLAAEGSVVEAREALHDAQQSLRASGGAPIGYAELRELRKRLGAAEGAMHVREGEFALALQSFQRFVQAAPLPTPPVAGATAAGQSVDDPVEDAADILDAFTEWARAASNLGHSEDAFEVLERVRHMQHHLDKRLLWRDGPGSGHDLRLRTSTALTASVLAEVQLSRKRTTKALDAAKRAVHLLREAGGRGKDRMRALTSLGEVLLRAGRASDAENAYREARNLAVERYGDDGMWAAASTRGLAAARVDQGDAEGAFRLYHRALGLQRGQGVAHTETVITLGAIAALSERTGHRAEALATARRAVAAARFVLPTGNPVRVSVEQLKRFLQTKARKEAVKAVEAAARTSKAMHQVEEQARRLEAGKKAQGPPVATATRRPTVRRELPHTA